MGSLDARLVAKKVGFESRTTPSLPPIALASSHHQKMTAKRLDLSGVAIRAIPTNYRPAAVSNEGTDPASLLVQHPFCNFPEQ
jgi:hypothetical protein